MGIHFERNNDRGFTKPQTAARHGNKNFSFPDEAGIIDLVMSPGRPQHPLRRRFWDRIRDK